MLRPGLCTTRTGGFAVKSMKLGGVVPLVLLVLSLTVVAPGRAAAQSSVTNADIQRLQDNIYDVSREVSQDPR